MSRVTMTQCDGPGCEVIAKPGPPLRVPYRWFRISLSQEGVMRTQFKVFHGRECLLAYIEEVT